MDIHERRTGVPKVPAEAACSVCGAPLVKTSRYLAGIYRHHDHETVPLEVHTAMVCPKRLGFAGFLFFHHDRRIFNENGAEVVLKPEEIEIAI